MNDDGLPPVRYSARSTGPCECSATVRPPSHSPTNRQTYKPDESVALTNEQRVASIHHDERVRLTGEGEPHEPGMRTQRHHRRGQLSWPTAIPAVPAISDNAGTQRHLAAAGHRFSSGGRHHARPVRAVLVADQSGAKHAGRLLNGLGMNGSAAVGFAAGMNADTVWTMCAYTSVVAEYGLVGLVLLVIASIVSMTRVFDTAAAGHGVWSKTVICWLVLIVYLYIQCENYAFAALPLFIFAASRLRK